MKSDLDDHIKTKNSFVFGENGRLVSRDGTLSFVSVKGTEEVLNDSRIVKYLGAESFKDQLVVFVKASGVDLNIGGIIYETVNVNVPVIQPFVIDLVSGTFAITDEISDNSDVVTYSESVATPAPDSDIVLDDNYDPPGNQDQEVDLDDYYKENINVPGFAACEIQAGSIPPNNSEYADVIMSITKDENGNFVNKVIWAGYQNWPIDGKIVALGVEETSKYRRIKYTDFVNTFKSINVLDPGLAKRTPKELENFQSTTMLEPRIDSVNSNGQLRSMSVQYTYRLITANGQVTGFSPFSKVQYIYPDNPVAIEGGDPEEVTNKSVRIQIDIMDIEGFSEIEAVALEFQGAGLPTGVKSLGIKKVSHVVTFDHFGTESDLGTEITVSDTLQNSANWKYCSDLETKNNKLLAFGLRNTPITNDYERLKIMFALHGWSNSKQTHTSFVNPDPKTYRWMPPTLTDPLFHVKKRVYSQIRSFGSTAVSLHKISEGEYITTMVSGSGNVYRDITEEISIWLLDIMANDQDYSDHFSDLEIVYEGGVILFQNVNPASTDDMADYELVFSNDQVLYDLDDENVFSDPNVAPHALVHGAMSAGYNSGTGIRLSFKMVEDPLLDMATGAYTGSGSVLNMHTPSLKKGFMKNEIYRLGIQLYQNGERIFAIPMGDIHIPALNDSYFHLDDSGNIVATSQKYVNQKVVGNTLYGVRVEIKAEVRFDCSMSKKFDSYQLLFVERDQNNRTILCQGISAPLIRIQDPVDFISYDLDEKLQRKWILPYHGGPLYDKVGFDEYDALGQDNDNPTYDGMRRLVNHRRLFYFDAPDLVYGKVAENIVESSMVKVLGRLNTDHQSDCIMISGENIGGFPQQTYPRFSTKLNIGQLSVPASVNDLPKLVGDNAPISNNYTWQTHFVNVSVFSSFTHYNASLAVDSALDMTPGRVVPGGEFGTNFEVSNNAFVLPSMPWWYSNKVRAIEKDDDQYRYEAFPRGGHISPGGRTMFIRTQGDLFTDAFIGTPKTNHVDPQIVIPADAESFTSYDTHALINIERNNADSVYGGRSEQAFSRNIFIPLSQTKPISGSTNAAQVFQVEGDTYVTLWARKKNGHGDGDQNRIDRNLNNGRGAVIGWNQNAADLLDVKKLKGAWTYAVVLETSVEPKLNSGYEFFRETSGIDFSIPNDEVLNNAYLNINNYKKYIPKPFRFNDDPNFDNIVAASETKLSGEYYDAWSVFPVNEFQELDKKMGAVLNAAKFKDEVFAIQERQTSLLYIDRNVMVPTNEGDTINIQQGSGKTIQGYKIMSSYGTSIRRSLVKHLDFGFTFVDEIKKVLVKNFEEITIANQYHHDFYHRLNTEKLLDVNGYFDEEFKETCLNIVTDSGSSMIIYNEALKVLSGWREFNAPIYIPFSGKIYVPKEIMVDLGGGPVPRSQSLHENNKGAYLTVLDRNLKMKLSFVCSPFADETFIFPHIAWVMNDGSDFESITVTTKEGLTRQLLPTHPRYIKREGKHTIPTLNYFVPGGDSDEKKDIRSEWALFEFVFPYNEGTLRKLNRVVNYIRLSYQ